VETLKIQEICNSLPKFLRSYCHSSSLTLKQCSLLLLISTLVYLTQFSLAGY
jgi:hypothetical protein